MRHTSLLKTLLAAAVAPLIISGCGESSSSSAGPDFGTPSAAPSDFNQAALLNQLTDNIITPAYTQFADLSEQLVADISSYCNSEIAFANDSGSNDQVALALTAAQQSWKTAMSQWQQIELMQVAPLLNNDRQLRNRIYSWPIVSTCGVDLDVVSYETGDINGTPFDIAQRTPARKGLDALEYLLFNPQLDHSCGAPPTPEGWNNRDQQSRKIARCQHAQAIANDIQGNAQQLLDQWQGTDGFATVLKTAGTVGNEFVTEHAALNHISDAMFYIDSITKDGKLATPLGLFANSCGAEPCLEDLESPYAGHSLENIVNNLIALQMLYTGGEGLGFDDYLVDVGDADTAQTMTTTIAAAIDSLNAYQASLATTLADDPEQVAESHQRVKAITDTMKSDYINSLALELPATSAGDND